ncbi:MAG: phosphate ABC transporter permease subunit PstC [Gammaproteobacteria bacterium]|nr:phosphate ABC transporter permease subunit PstC [Gammaproteobacteria bacterium]
MTLTSIFILVIALGGFSWFTASSRVKRTPKAKGSRPLALPHYYGAWSMLWTVVPALALFALYFFFEQTIVRALVINELPLASQSLTSDQLALLYSKVVNNVSGDQINAALEIEYVPAAERLIELNSFKTTALFLAIVFVCIAGFGYSVARFSPQLHARVAVERWVRAFLFLSSLIAILTTLGILLSVIFESLRFFEMVSPLEFLFGTHWSPQVALRADQTASSGSFGAVPLFAGTLLIAAIAMAVALPIGMYSAIYLSEYASSRARSILKPILEILAGIPTVVYGFFAALTVAPAVRQFVEWLGEKLTALGVIDAPFQVSSESALAAGVVMGVMLIPFISSMADDVIRAVPASLRDGSFGLGATRSETMTQVILPAALPGVVGGIMLAVSRAIGETMIVVMAAGLSAKLTANPFESVTTVTVQIATLLVGDQEFDSPKTLAAFALGLVLFVVTLLLNVIALHVVNKYREQYD